MCWLLMAWASIHALWQPAATMTNNKTNESMQAGVVYALPCACCAAARALQAGL